MLEDTLGRWISALLGADETGATIILAESSFKAKVHILASLVRARAKSRRFNTGDQDAVEMFSELVGLCFRAEELRNQLMHSSWSGYPGFSRVISRIKTTAKARRGLHTHTEPLDGDYIMDIADFIGGLDVVLDEYFLDS